MNRHIRLLSRRAQLREFIVSESGEMSVKKAALIGAIMATSALASLLLTQGTAQATCHFGGPCDNDHQCGAGCVCWFPPGGTCSSP